MRQAQAFQVLSKAALEFEKHDWLEEAIIFGPALDDDPVDSDVDLLLIAERTLSAREAAEAEHQLRSTLEARLRQPLALRISTRRAMESVRGEKVGAGRHLKGRYRSVFKRAR